MRLRKKMLKLAFPNLFKLPDGRFVEIDDDGHLKLNDDGKPNLFEVMHSDKITKDQVDELIKNNPSLTSQDIDALNELAQESNQALKKNIEEEPLTLEELHKLIDYSYYNNLTEKEQTMYQKLLQKYRDKNVENLQDRTTFYTTIWKYANEYEMSVPQYITERLGFNYKDKRAELPTKEEREQEFIKELNAILEIHQTDTLSQSIIPRALIGRINNFIKSYTDFSKPSEYIRSLGFKYKGNRSLKDYRNNIDLLIEELKQSTPDGNLYYVDKSLLDIAKQVAADNRFTKFENFFKKFKFNETTKFFYKEPTKEEKKRLRKNRQ